MNEATEIQEQRQDDTQHKTLYFFFFFSSPNSLTIAQAGTKFLVQAILLLQSLTLT